MDSRRLHYLRALDIDVWQRRDRQVELSPPAAIAPSVAVIRPVASVVPVSPVAKEPPLVSVAPAVAATKPAPVPVNDVADPLVPSMDWETLFSTVKACTRCDLHSTRT